MPPHPPVLSKNNTRNFFACLWQISAAVLCFAIPSGNGGVFVGNNYSSKEMAGE